MKTKRKGQSESLQGWGRPGFGRRRCGGGADSRPGACWGLGQDGGEAWGAQVAGAAGEKEGWEEWEQAKRRPQGWKEVLSPGQ